MANPAPIISTFLMDPTLQKKIRMDGICTVVDAKHVGMHLDRKEETGDENEACAQVAYADRIVLNKTDLVSSSDLGSLSARIQGINKLAAMQSAQNSVVPVDYVLGIGGYALDEISNQVWPSQRKDMRTKHRHTLPIRCAVALRPRRQSLLLPCSCPRARSR